MNRRTICILDIEDNEDDFLILRRCLKKIDSITADLHHVADPAKAIESLAEIDPDIVLLDHHLGAQTGLEVLQQMRKSGHFQPVIILTGAGDEYLAAEVTRAGATDYINKDDLEPDRLESVLNRVLIDVANKREHQEERSEILKKLATLTPRELEVLDSIVDGLTNKAIAAEFFRSVETIKVHRARIMDKMQASTAADVVRMAMIAKLSKPS